MPGVQIPGSQVSLPLAYGILSLFLVVIIHEFSHGVMARAYQIPVKSSGIVLFGPLLGAFVEPDETLLRKQPAKIQLSVFSAGPFSNVLSALLVYLIVFPFVLPPMIGFFFETGKVEIVTVRENGPAAQAGVTPTSIIAAFEGRNVSSLQEVTALLQNVTPGQSYQLVTDKGTFSVVPETAKDHPVIGVTLQEQVLLKSQSFGNVPWLLIYFARFMMWFVVISIGIGIANLLPLGPVDGGRMLQVAAGKQGLWLWSWVGTLLFLAIIFILLFPFFTWLVP